ncbi:unnamed protein product [Spirodela intermedia]|uniref:Uncharacterized protein n=2 Tax=Spirodela intermedia TaxID=51605 RepID=A0A7I8KQW9_SPIIN|nr:unnamed protein product [Spirodela intermedia]CAA6663730.1 unnamed protein product [Spirodela intermedia]CAA7400223.1 unnamed protein product [Spirodela intermedia]
MAEEQCQSPPECPRLCANNCGFFGSSATLDLCSKCYRDHHLKAEQDASAKMAVEKSFLPSASALDVDPSPSLPSLSKPKVELSSTSEPPSEAAPLADVAAAPSKKAGRCTECSKRAGLTGFKCRCGHTFCGSHRYPEQHSCEFDFKSAGREAIARANPVVKADKLLDKI